MIDDTQHDAVESHRRRAGVEPRRQRPRVARATSATLAGTDDVPAYAAAARVDDVAGLPPAWIGVGSLDVFRDEDVAYALAPPRPRASPPSCTCTPVRATASR